jgi:hemerythrin-like domain-containing protein
MNTATKNLEEDHVHILKLIEVMEHVTRIDDPDINHLEKIVEIIKNFADGVHHAKEENVFFPMLSKKGFPSNQGPVAVMLNEHVQGRKYVRGMEENILLFKSGNKPSLMDVYQNMNSYIELLRNHIEKENNVLFRMADNVLSESDHHTLLGKFADEENKYSSRAKSAVYIQLIRELTSFYKV